MRPDAVQLLRCPRCRTSGTLSLRGSDEGGEVRSGAVVCAACGHRAPVTRGVADLLFDPPDFVRREADGLARFAELMRNDGWDRARVLNLPDEDEPFWWGQRTSFAALRSAVDFRPGERLLDIGANTCWASAAFARDGLEVIALDISPHEMQGVETADWWMERDGTHFERLLGVMFDLPVADGALDHVFCCEVLHHNSLVNLHRTMREAFRVLKPGGRLSVIRETLRAPGDLQLRPGHEVAAFEGHEHAFLASSYLVAARAAGFEVSVMDPAGHWVLSGAPFAEPTRARARLKLGVLEAVRSRPRSRRLYRAWLHHVTGGVPMHFLARKPGSVN